MNDFYDQYFSNSSQILDTWLNHLKIILWDFVDFNIHICLLAL